MFDKIVQMNLLYDFYGQLLTPKQQEVLQLYYSHDLSLGEIAEQLGVSRQAVYDTIKRTEKLLYAYEKKLGLVCKFITTKNQIQEILTIIENIDNYKYVLNTELQFVVEAIEKIKKISYDILEK
ncbi:putative DNA-binding protein [Clostridiaceae bacterium 35-E11]